MEQHLNFEDTGSFIYHKMFRQFEGTNTCDDFLLKSDLFSKSTKGIPKTEQLQDKIFSLQKERSLMKNVLEEEIFKLKQHYETLKSAFREFKGMVLGLLVQAQVDIEEKRLSLFPQDDLERTVLEMKEKIGNIQVVNYALRQENERMVKEIETLRATFSQNGGLENKVGIIKDSGEKEAEKLKALLVEKERRIRYLEYKQQHGLKTKRYDSEENFRLLTSPSSLHSPYKHLKSLNGSSGSGSGITTPVTSRQRQRGSDFTEEFGGDNSRGHETFQKSDSSFTFTRAKPETIPEQVRPRIITRKPGVTTTFYRPPRHTVNLSQLESRLDNMKKELRNQIKSVEKRRG